MITNPININSNGEILALKAKRYKMFMLGGWKVKLGNFSVKLKDVKTSKYAKVQLTKWPVQSYMYGKKSKQIFIIDIEKEGDYEISFIAPYSLEVKKSNLPILSMFFMPIKNENIEIYISD